MKPITKIIVEVVVGLILVGAIVVLWYFIWQTGRWINYNLSYEDMVQKTVCEMVKTEHLKDPTKCKEEK